MKVKQILSPWSNGITLWLLFLLSGVFLYLFNGTKLSFSLPTLSKYFQELSPLETTVIYSPEYVFRVLEQIGQKGREAYFNFLEVDLIFTLVYTAFFALAMVYLHNQKTFIRKLGNIPLIAPWVGGLFDYLENLSLLGVLIFYPQNLKLFAIFCSLATPLKTLFFLGNSLLLILGFIQLLLGRIKKQPFA
jgi:hypothetical protein